MTENHSVLDRVLGWLNAGFPDGVPPKDHFALLALLQRTLTEEEVVAAAQSILRNGDADTPVSREQICEAIKAITDNEPNPDEVQQVSARLASVGWPLAAPAG